MKEAFLVKSSLTYGKGLNLTLDTEEGTESRNEVCLQKLEKASKWKEMQVTLLSFQ
jgi:hypothetical protein